MTATVWSHMEAGPHRGTRGGKGPRARLFNALQQIVVDEYKRQDRRFRWVRFADASKQQIEALFSWRESLDSWHLWNFDQEAFEVIQAADNAYQQRLASVEAAGVVLPQGVQSQDKAAASGAAEAASSAAGWLRPPTPPSASSWLQDSRTPLPRIRPSAEERQVLRGAAKTALRGVYARAAETRRESSRERSPQRSRSPSPRRSRSPSPPRRGPTTAATPVEHRAHSVEPALAREGRPSRTSLATRPIVLAPQNSIYPVTRFDEHGIGYSFGRLHSHVRRHLTAERQADPYSLADETWRDPPRRSSTSSRSRSPDRRPGPAEHYRLDAYSSEEEPPQDAESIRTGRSAYVPRRVYEAPTHTEPIALHSRRIGAIQPPPPKAAPKVIFGSKPPLPKELPRAASSAPAKADIPRKSPPRARSPIRTQSAFGYKAPPRGLNKAEPRSKSGSNPPQGYIVKPPPPQVVKAAAASAATSEAGARFRSPPRRPPPAPPPPPGRPVPPKEPTSTRR